MSSRKWAIVHTVILAAFCFGYWIGIGHPELIVQRPSSEPYLETRERIDSLERLLPDVVDTVYQDQEQIILLHPLCYVAVLKKYSPKKTFENYIVPGKFKGKTPTLNFSTCSTGKRFITVTKAAVADTAQFAGYYAFARWGCGSPCQMCSIIDLRTGNVYSGPYASGGYEYRADSRILIVNPPDSNGYYYANSVWPPPEQYLWTGNSFKRLE